ncbi:MAG: UDP-N-acetylmuramoyl-tripeptide--D-alanyl-D-alanine ligase [Planctomycetota bacterium]|jgi:UDP-N-acetylmuramoyl-tripeptide--D-alanyl-D-alanine ligase|nr:UDP-N-acetylmuramoyl-tripeptide--D-alanyl-D-alanine ligase [Planctomycetota bacterium]
MISMTLEQLALVTGGLRTGDGGDRVFDGVSIDSRTLSDGDVYFCLKGERFDGHQFASEAVSKGASAIVHDADLEGIAGELPCIRVNDVQEALAQLASWVRAHSQARVVTVTGSVGKTTTKEMLGHVLAGDGPTVASPKSFNNEIGVPLTLLSINEETRHAVVEIGGNHHGEIRELTRLAAPDAGILTRLGRAHLGGFGTIDGVVKAKSEMLENLGDRDVFFNADDKRQVALSWGFFGKAVTYGKNSRACHRIDCVQESMSGIRFRMGGTRYRIPVLGRWNVESAGAVVSYCLSLGMSPQKIAERLLTFRGAPMRMRLHRYKNVYLINDAYNACPDSAEEAVHFLARRFAGSRRVLVFGDMLELGQDSCRYHRQLGKKVVDLGIEVLVTVGAAAAGMGEAAQLEASRRGKKILIRTCEDAGVAGRCLDEWLLPGDRILLKASRRMGLETLVGVVRERFGARKNARKPSRTKVAG